MNETGASAGLEHLPRPLAFVFSGGVAHGAMQVGMLRAAMEHHLTPDFLVGSSAGAINAAFMAGAFTRERWEQLRDVWIRLRFTDVFGEIGLLRTGWALVKAGTLASPEPLLRLIRQWIPKNHQDCALPVHVVATSLLTGETRLLSTGDLHQHLLASTAIPFVFPEVEVDGLPLVDGSVSAHVPMKPAETLGARSLVVFDVGAPCRLTEMPENPLDRALHLVAIMLHQQCAGAPELLDSGLTVLYPPAPCPIKVPNYDFSQSEHLLEGGYQSALRFFRQLELNGPGIYRLRQ